MADKKILLSGVKPTGRPHIGNYFGAMRQFVELQNDYEAYIFIADLHALTTVQNREELEKNTLGVLLDYMAIGLDPKNVTLYKQSDVPQVTELTWIFNCLTPMPYLMRAHAFKDQVTAENMKALRDRKGDFSYDFQVETVFSGINTGLFTYPLLMAADILLPEADVVPVGKDQKQHIEYTRDTAQKFNNAFGETFKLPEPLILEGVSVIQGVDGRKMSKSYGNVIPLFATDEEIEKQVMSIVTGVGGTTPELLHNIHELIRGEITNDWSVSNSAAEFYDLYTNNKNNYKFLKETLIQDLKTFIKPMRDKRQAFSEDKNYVLEVLKEGGKKAGERMEKKMEEVRKAVGLKLY